MKALLMAAGVGSRISRHLGDKPKCCVDIAGKPLIRYTVELLKKNGINEIAIVTGYNHHYIHKALEGLEVVFFTNPFFDVTNSIASTWFAKEFLDEDTIVMNGDVFMEAKLLQTLLMTELSPLFLADSTRINDADYRFFWQDGLLEKFGKELSNKETTGEYVGIAKIAKEDIPFMKEELEKLINTQKHNFWWEDIFYQNLKKKSLHVKDIAGIFWAEVDYIEDYERIQNYLRQTNG